MSKNQRSKPAAAVLDDPIANYVREVKQERSDALIASIGVAGEIIENAQSLVENGIGFTFQKRPNKSLLSNPEIGRALTEDRNSQTTFAVEVEYYPIPREDEARPCSLCESRRPAGKSYSRVYCTKRQVRYCKCHYCGHTWSQERK